MARSNGDLIAKARQLTEELGRRPATVEEARALLGIDRRRRGTRRERAAARRAHASSTSRGCCPGGFCSLLLADFGADVIKVEDTGIGDYVRWSPPYYEGADDTRRERAVPGAEPRQALDPDRPQDTTRARRCCCALARDADVLLESFRPGVLDRLGVGYERLREENPRLVYCAITGYGQDGPNRDRSGHDMNYLGLNGLLGLTGEPTGRRSSPPARSPTSAAGR